MQSTSGAYFTRLDHLRFFAALMVICWHSLGGSYMPTMAPSGFWPLSFFQEGHTGVALFMTLSGFIFYSLCRDKEIVYFQFIRNRILRIAPLFLIWMFFLYLKTNTDPLKMLLAIFAFMNFPNILEVGWTVVVEFQFYLLFPFLLLFARKLGIRYLIGLMFIAMAFRLGSYLTGGPPAQSFSYYTVFGRIDQFLLGMIGAEVYFRHSKTFSKPIFLLLVIGIWSYVYHQFDLMGGYALAKPQIWLFLTTLEGFFYALITICYLSASFKIPKMLDTKLAWLGMLSFSLYMNHILVITLAVSVFNRLGIQIVNLAGGMVFALFICTPLTVLASIPTYYLIERPFLLLRKNYLS